MKSAPVISAILVLSQAGLAAVLVSELPRLLTDAPVESRTGGRVLELPAISDSDLEAALVRRLSANGYSSEEIGVQVHHGIVTLAGAARNPRAKDETIADVEATRGVRAVVDRVKVIPPKVSDSSLRRNVETALRLDPSTSVHAFGVKVARGRVRLTGKSPNKASAELATWVAQGVDGVKSVENSIRVPVRPVPSDGRLLEQVRSKVGSDRFLGNSEIAVNVHQGAVVLSGRVDSVAARNRAVDDAWSSDPAAVHSEELRVDPTLSASGRGANGPYRISDFDIWNAVDSALKEDPRIGSFRPKVSVDSGVVTLSGFVDSLIARESAGEDAAHVLGAAFVKNELIVPPPRLADPAIRANVERSIRIYAPELHGRVVVSVLNGGVKLQGEVPSVYQKWLAWDSAARSPGVQSVDNEIRTNPATPAPRPGELRDAIRAALKTDALIDPYSSIRVEVNGSQALLKGSVSGSADRVRACEDAFEAGATRVTEDLETELPSGAVMRKGPKACG